jgi:ABC-type glycerol-3-phosphate transport system substrate-binding protein
MDQKRIKVRTVCRVVCVQLAIFIILGMQLTAVAQTPQKVTINFLNGWNGDRIPLIEEVIRRFEERYPWIEVIPQIIAPTELVEKIMVSVVANAAPDLVMVSFADSIRFGPQGLLSDLNSFIKKDGMQLKNYIYPSVVDQITNHPLVNRGDIYFLPQMVATSWFMYYNIDHFNESGISADSVPKTWSQLEQVARRLSRPAADGTFERLGIDVANYKIAGPYNSWLESAGGYSYSDDLRRVVLGEPSSYGLQTLEWIVDFTNEVNRGLANQEKLSGGGRTGFYNKQFSILMDGSFASFQIMSAAPDINLGVAERPIRDGANSGPSTSLSWGYGIPTNAAHPEEAWLLMKFLTMELDGGGYFMLQQGRPSASMQINAQRQFAQTIAHWPLIQETMNKSVPAAPTPPLGTVVDNATKALVREAVTGQYSPQAALDRAITTWQNALNDYWKNQAK